MSDKDTRTFEVRQPLMQGGDVKDFQQRLQTIFCEWRVDYDLAADGVYGGVSRSACATVVHGFGGSARSLMKDGVTPKLRGKIRRWQDGEFTDAERARFRKRRDWRRELRDRHADRDVASPLSVILQDSWGYHPPVHDGLDLICKPSAPLLAICKAKVIRADAGGWWGKGAPAAAVAAKGDGIIVLRSLTDVGPFAVGLNFGYGHAESPVVKVGQVVEAGEVIGHAGFANAWHIHLVVNGRQDALGVGDRDPRPFVDYARRSG